MTVMVQKLEDDLVMKVGSLPVDKQRRVLEFVESLRSMDVVPRGESLAGTWEKYGIELSEEDFAQLRREIWARFPRDL
jgi:hypothetical protein